MDKVLADMILDYREEIFPYLVLRAYYIKYFDLGDTFKSTGKITDEERDILEVSGLIRIEDNSIIMFENGNWLGYPKETPASVRKEAEKYIPQELEFLATQMGHPVDFYKNSGKYVRLFNLMKKKRSDSDIQKVVIKYLEEKQPDWDLRMILSDKSFNILLKKKNSPDKYVQRDRRESEYKQEGF